MSVQLKITNYLDVASSWCFWAEPAWAELQRRFAGRAEFDWKIALMNKEALPVSRAQEAWFYRRSGLMNRSPFMLRTEWYEFGPAEYLAPNAVAEAARKLGVKDDRVRLAIANGGLRDGKMTGRWEVATEIAAAAGGLDPKALLERAKSPEIEKRVRATTAEFYALNVTQRPTFVIDSEIGDRAVFSGFAKIEPLAATLDAMLDDLAAYRSHEAHFGAPPAE